jgi:hypothetical protein
MADCRWITVGVIDNRVQKSGADEMKPDKANIEIWDLGGNGIQCALAVDGLVRYVGARAQCLRRAQILAVPGDRERQDRMLARSIL